MYCIISMQASSDNADNVDSTYLNYDDSVNY